jgi:O-antigen/teichoic acid export membrane protein
MLALTAVNLVTGFAFAYLRALERSMLFLAVTAGGLVLRIALNLWLLVALHLGVVGYLASGVVAGGVQAAVLLALLFAGRPLRFERRIWRELGSFAGPIAIAALASLAMHQADLWILRFKLGDLGEIGLYAFAYAMAQRFNGLLLTPFSSIWSARLYEIDRGPRRLEAYHRAFRGYTLVSAMALLGLALCAQPVVALLAKAAYQPAAALVPILVAGFFLFSLHGFFVVPALLTGRSGAIAWNAVLAAAVDIVLCLVLVPVDGIRGAAVASVAAYGVYSLGGWLRYRGLENLRYPLGHLAKLASIAVVAWATRPSPPPGASPWLALVIAGAWALLAAGVAVLWCGRDLVPLRSATRTESDPGAAPEPVVERTVASQEVDAVEAFLG